MSIEVSSIRQTLDSTRTTWHITVGTYGSRLHGGDRPTVDRHHNQLGEDFIWRDERFEQYEKNIMRAEPVILTREQCAYIEEQLPQLCERGGWTYRACASPGEGDHFHLLCDAPPHVHGEQIRTLIKRWLTQALEKKWAKPASGKWWVDKGSTKPVKDEGYLNRAFPYIRNQRTTPPREPPRPSSEPPRPRGG